MTIDPSDIKKSKVEKFIDLLLEEDSSSKPISSSSSIAGNSPEKEEQLEDYITNPILTGFKSEILSSRNSSKRYSLPYGKSFNAELADLTFSGIPAFHEKYRRTHKGLRNVYDNWHFLVYPGKGFAQIVRNKMLEILESQDALRYRHWLALTIHHLEDHPLFNISTLREAFNKAINNFEHIKFLKFYQIPELKTLRAAKVYLWPSAHFREFKEVQDLYYRFIPSDPKKNRKIPKESEITVLDQAKRNLKNKNARILGETLFQKQQEEQERLEQERLEQERLEEHKKEQELQQAQEEEQKRLEQEQGIIDYKEELVAFRCTCGTLKGLGRLYPAKEISHHGSKPCQPKYHKYQKIPIYKLSDGTE